MTNEIEFLATKVFQDTWEATQSGNYKLIEQKGSSRSSKTWSDFQVIFLDLFENPMTTCTILRDTQKSCREIIEIDWIKWLSDPMGRKKQLEDKLIDVKQFDEFIAKESLLDYFLRNKTNHTWTFKHNNSFIRFTGLDDEDDAMGMTQDICWINEPYNFSHEVYKQLSQRTAKYIIFDMIYIFLLLVLIIHHKLKLRYNIKEIYLPIPLYFLFSKIHQDNKLSYVYYY